MTTVLIPPQRRMKAIQVVSAYTRWIPILWLTGFQVLGAAILTVWLAFSRKLKAPRARILLAVWLFVGVVQSASIVANWSWAGEDAIFLLRRLLSLHLLGWVGLGFLLSAGCELRAATPLLIRSIVIMSLGYIGFGFIALGIYFANGGEEFEVPTLLGQLFASSENWQVYTQAKLYSTEGLWNFQAPRLTLFAPYPTVMGMAGACVFFVSRLETSWRWRWVGTAAGLFAIAFSFSRAAAPAFLLALCVYLAFRRAWLLLASLAIAAVAALLLLALVGSDPSSWGTAVTDSLRGARSGSSSARDLIYESSWKAFLDAPVFGWGWVGSSVLDTENLPIGSHSTFYGTLYTGGLTTFLTLAGAMITLGLMLASNALHSSKPACAGLGVFTVILVFGFSESLYSSILPLAPIFLCLGGMAAREPMRTDTCFTAYPNLVAPVRANSASTLSG